MEDAATSLITLGALFLVGLATDLLARRTQLPRVTLLLLVGLLIGPAGLGLLPDIGQRWFALVASMALVMVGFLLGGTLTVATLREHGREVLGISGGVVIASVVVVSAVLMLVGAPPAVALLLGGIATSTAPAATVDVVRACKADGPFTRTLLGIVAVDDAWGLLLFSVLLAGAHTILGDAGAASVLAAGARELIGAVVLGTLLAVPMALLTGRIQPGEPTLAEALGMVLLCGGLAMHFDVSFLLAAMVMGALVVNLASHHRRPFHAIEGIEWPFMILFFILTGASLRLDSLLEVGGIGVAYVAARALARVGGSWVGGGLVGCDVSMRWWMGLALMPQAGVALGMALVAAQRFPELRHVLLPTVVGATVAFELVGPVLTRIALARAGETGRAGGPAV